MTDDPIMAELRAAPDRLAARFGYDVKAIYRHIQAREAVKVINHLGDEVMKVFRV